MKRAWLSFIRGTLNRVTGGAARRGSARFSLVRSIGRTSGREYETPIIVSPVADGFVAELTYGPEVNWYRNIVATGHCVIVHRGVEHMIDRIEPMDAPAGLAAYPAGQRIVLRLLRRRDFIHLHETAS